jgi:hypothetical protein
MFRTADSPLLSIGEGPCVDHVDGPIFVQYENNLKKPPALSSAPDKPFIIFNPPWERTSRPEHHDFSLLWKDPMSTHMVDVPVIPAEVHELIMQ